MKPLTLLLVGSLAANTALAIFYFTRSSSPTNGLAVERSASASGSNAAAVSGSPVDAQSASTGPSAETWTALQSGDLPTLVARLRAAGFPPNLVRALVAEQVRVQFAARRKELFASVQEQPFWKIINFSVGLDPKIMAAQRNLGREQRDLLKQLLGEDPEEDPASQFYARRQYGDLPKAKIEQVQKIASDYNDLRNEVYTASNGMMLPEDREKLAYIEKELRADIATVLTPQEMLDYEMRSSGTANYLRSQLTAFNPTEQEYRALFAAAQAVEAKFGPLNAGGGGPDQYRQRQTAIAEQAKAVLSPERYAEFQQAIDPQTSSLSRLVARLELPSTTVKQVVSVQQEIQQRANTVRSNRDLAADQRTAQLAALQQEATAKLTTTLGARGVEAYKQYGGQWINSLTQTPPARPLPASVPASTPAAQPKG